MDLRFLEAMALRAQAMEVDCADNDNEFPTIQRRRRRVVLLRHFLECASTKHLDMWLRRKKLNSLDWIRRLATYRSKEGKTRRRPRRNSQPFIQLAKID